MFVFLFFIVLLEVFIIFLLYSISYYLLVWVRLPVIVGFLLVYLHWFLSSRDMRSNEKCSPYECGFEPFNKDRQSFSVRFFLIAILFVIFDVELCILTPFLFCILSFKSISGLLRFILFMAILFFGLLHEFREGSLEWVK